MNDVIQGILDDLDYCKNRKRGNISLEYHECDLLLDYITNLQQDNTMYAQLKDEYEEEIKDLQQENEKLKELCDKYEEEHNTAFKLWKIKMEEMPTYEEKEDYKSRIDKAIDYIENELFNGKDDLEWCRRNDGTISGSDLPAYCILDLYDILKGDSNE